MMKTYILKTALDEHRRIEDILKEASKHSHYKSITELSEVIRKLAIRRNELVLAHLDSGKLGRKNHRRFYRLLGEKILTIKEMCLTSNVDTIRQKMEIVIKELKENTPSKTDNLIETVIEHAEQIAKYDRQYNDRIKEIKECNYRKKKAVNDLEKSIEQFRNMLGESLNDNKSAMKTNRYLKHFKDKRW